MAEAKSKTKEAKVFDVAKPGKSTPPTTSKPVIVTNRPVLTDPMVTTDNASQAPQAETEKTAVPSVSKVKIEPISQPEDLKSSDDTAVDESDHETEAPEQDTSSEAVTRNTLKDVDTDEQGLAERKAAEHQANINKIALAKTYYLPINQVVRRRSKQVAVAGLALIVLLGAAWLDVSLDAGLIDIPGVKAPTHFFSN